MGMTGAQASRLHSPLGLGRIDDADNVAMLMKIERQLFTVWSGRLQAGMNLRHFVFGEPGTKFIKAFFEIAELVVTQFFNK